MDLKSTNFKNSFYKILLIAICLFSAKSVMAQASFSASMDIYNQYIWRGFNFGDSPSLQPSFMFDDSNFEIGVWGAFSTMRNPTSESKAYTETDAYASYTIPTASSGSFSLGITDYFLPYTSTGYYFDFNNYHVFEANLGYTGPKSFPIGLSANINFAGADKKHSVYLQASYPILTAELTLGFIPMKTGYYGQEEKGSFQEMTKPGLVLIGFSNTQDVKITDKFSLPVNGAVQVNPYTKNIYLLFGVTI